MSGQLTSPAPQKIQLIGLVHLIAGILNLLSCFGIALYGLGMGVATFGIGLLACCPLVLMLPVSVAEIVSGARHLSSNHAGLRAPKVTAILEIICVIFCSPWALLAGILTLVFMGDPEVEAYYRQTSGM